MTQQEKAKRKIGALRDVVTVAVALADDVLKAKHNKCPWASVCFVQQRAETVKKLARKAGVE